MLYIIYNTYKFMDDQWKNKYLKYKFKYNELKKLIGAAEPNLLNNESDNKMSPNEEINTIIVTHNGRLRCLMNLFEKGLGSVRFKNCAILKLKIKNLTSELDLIYSGSLALDSIESDEDSVNSDNDTLNSVFDSVNSANSEVKIGGGKKKYYVSMNDKNIIQNDIPFKTITSSTVLGFLNLKPEDLDSQKTYTFYLIRHGDGMHNKAKVEKKKGLYNPSLIDARLTDEGKKQAVEAGKQLKNILGATKINYLFASDLKRTRETLENVLAEGVELSTNLKDVIILPCSHELDYKKNSCDGNQPNVFSSENKMSCSSINSSCVQTPNNTNNNYCSNISKPSNEGVLCLNWNFYNLFYANKNRTNLDIFSSRFHCRDTSMISLSIFIIKNPNCSDRNLMKQWIEQRKNSSKTNNI